MPTFRLLDDLHAEFGVFNHQFKTKADVCLLAGDIGIADTELMVDTVLHCARQHELTILVPGNHEYYHREFHAANKWMHTELKRVAELEGRRLEIFAPHGFTEFDGVPIVGGTFWTDFDGGNYIDMIAARRYMNDYRLISVENDNGEIFPLTPEFTYEQNKAAREFIGQKLVELNNPRAIIVTHHAPLYNCSSPAYRGHEMQSSYCNTGLDSWFAEKQFAAWCHGHVHTSNRMEVNERAVLSNARGYVGYETNSGFDPEFVFEV